MLSPFAEGLQNVTLVFICNIGKGQQQEFCRGILDHSVNKSTRVRRWLKKEQTQEAYWCLTFASLSWTTLASYTAWVHKGLHLTKDKRYQKNDKPQHFCKPRWLCAVHMKSITYNYIKTPLLQKSHIYVLFTLKM